MRDPDSTPAHEPGAAAAFLVISLSFGVLFALITPPFQTPDEPSHFFRAVSLSEGQLFTVTQGADRGASLPAWSVELATALLGSLPIRPDETTSLAKIIDGGELAERQRGRRFVPLPPAGMRDRLGYSAANYPPGPYLVTAIALRVAAASGAPPLVAFYAGRLANLTFAACLIFLAIRVTPIGKWVFALLALTPMSLHLLASYSADAFTIATTLLLTALVLRACYTTDPLSIHARPSLPVAGFLAAIAKPTGALILLAPFAIPRKHFRSAGAYAGFLGAYGLSLVAGLFITVIWSGDGARTAVPDISASRQVAHILQHPFDFAGVLFRTYLEYSPRYFVELIGKLGWMDVFLPSIVIVTYYAVLIFAARMSAVVTTTQRGWLLAIFGASTLAVFVMMYCGLPVGSRLVEGVQGRYFLPAAPLLFTAFAPSTINPISNRVRTSWIMGIYSVIVLMVAAAAIIRRYYG
jgi:uncharacterized membrane protein